MRLLSSTRRIVQPIILLNRSVLPLAALFLCMNSMGYAVNKIIKKALKHLFRPSITNMTVMMPLALTGTYIHQ
ncbi:hypothetical protein ACUY4Q_001925 [Phytobacter sp. AG2a]